MATFAQNIIPHDLNSTLSAASAAQDRAQRSVFGKSLNH